MTNPAILGQLNKLHEMQALLLETQSEADAAQQFHPDLGSLNWLFGAGVYQELYWLREVLTGDTDLSQRVEKLFRIDTVPLREQCVKLPPKDHLLNWGREIQEEHLMRLANPGMLPNHQLLTNDLLQWFLLQEHAKRYETMLLVLNLHSLQVSSSSYRVKSPLVPSLPSWDTKELSQGHYRIGARNQPEAYDNEMPPQAVELSSYRIALQPVTNCQFLSFMESEGYKNMQFWSEPGQAWQQSAQWSHPMYWRQDECGHWYMIGINGPSDIPLEDPVTSISQYEAQAFANWAGSLGQEYHGAVLQHEYQWELAARSGVIKQLGRAWEWCSNNFHPYPEFQPFPDKFTSMPDFQPGVISLRGGSIHTQRVLRRASMRHRAPAEQRFQLSGLRLVFPARHTWT